MCSRPKRTKLKPLEFWKNERVVYTLDGEISQLNISSQNASHVKEDSSFKKPFPVTKSVLHRNLQETSEISEEKGSLSNTSLSSDQSQPFDETIKRKVIGRKNIRPRKKKKPLDVKSLKAQNAIKEDTHSDLSTKLSSSDSIPKDSQKEECRTSSDFNRPTYVDNVQQSVDINQIEAGEEDKCLFHLDNIFQVNLPRNGSCFAERGPYDSSCNAYTGIILISEPLLEFGVITSETELFFIDGECDIVLTDPESSHIISLHMKEGQKIRLKPKTNLVFKKTSKSIVKLFAMFIPDDNAVEK